MQSKFFDIAQAAEALAEAKRELVRVFEAMPRDLQQTMLSAPHRAFLLHGLRAHTKVGQADGKLYYLT